ncbi:hypothetical protein CHS0354_011341, partial [Potamilus streckersoni]
DCPKVRQTQMNVVSRKNYKTGASCKPANHASAIVNGKGATILYNAGYNVTALVDKKYEKAGKGDNCTRTARVARC